MTTRASIRMPRPVRQALVEHARRERPNECCGLLVGRARTVAFAVAMTNVDRSPVRYRVDDRAHIDLRRVLRAVRPPMSILGVYHSHPSGPPHPSPTDLAEAHYPAWVHVIVSLRGRAARIRAFRLEKGRAIPISIR